MAGRGLASIACTCVAVATSAAGAEPRVPCETTPKVFASVGLGLGGVSRVGDIPPVGDNSWRLQLGQRVAHGLHLVEELNSVASGYIEPFPSTTQDFHVSFGIGLRWTPLEPRSRLGPPVWFFPGAVADIQAFYVTVVAGANVRDRTTQTSQTHVTDDETWSPMASLAVGVPEFAGRDWSFGPEFREQLAHYDGHFQRGWMLMLAIHLESW